MEKEKKEFQKPEAEIIEFDQKNDIVTLSGGGEGMIEE